MHENEDLLPNVVVCLVCSIEAVEVEIHMIGVAEWQSHTCAQAVVCLLSSRAVIRPASSESHDLVGPSSVLIVGHASQ